MLLYTVVDPSHPSRDVGSSLIAAWQHVHVVYELNIPLITPVAGM